MADGSRFFLTNKWRHHDITAIVKDYLCLCQLLNLICHTYTILFNFFFCFEGKNWNGIWILPINLTSLCQSSDTLIISVWPYPVRFLSYRGRPPKLPSGRRKQKKPGLNVMTRPYFCWLLSYVFYFFLLGPANNLFHLFVFANNFFSQDFSFPFPKHSGSVPITSIWHPLNWKKVVGHWRYVFRFILLSDQMTPECQRWACLIYCYLARFSFCYNNVFYLCFEAVIRN